MLYSPHFALQSVQIEYFNNAGCGGSPQSTSDYTTGECCSTRTHFNYRDFYFTAWPHFCHFVIMYGPLLLVLASVRFYV